MSPTSFNLDSLERRILFSTFVVNATAGNDVISIEVAKGIITVSVNDEDFFALDSATDVIDVRGLGGDDSFTVISSGDNDIILSGDQADGSGSGNDTFHIAQGNLDHVASPVTVIGGGGDDLVILDDNSNLFGDTFTITDSTAWRFFFGGLTYSTDLERLILLGSRGASDINIDSTSPATQVSIDSGDGLDRIHVHQTHPLSPVMILPALANQSVNVNADSAGSAHAIFTQSQNIGGLTVGAGGLATLATGGAVLSLNSINIAAGGQLDLTDGSAIFDYPLTSPLPAIQSLLASGYNNGAWNGSGIISSTAAASGNTGIGLAESSDLFTTFPGVFAGQFVDSTAVLLTHTLYGDADLNGTVNLADFNRLAANFGQTGRRWSQGDFDYNATVNLSDFNALAANFGQALSFSGDASNSSEPDEQDERLSR